MFLTIYGTNNIGKSTQCKLLIENLQKKGVKALHIKYPMYEIEPSGPFLYNTLRGESQNITEQELQMWFAINRHQFQEKKRSLENEYDIIIAEDYTETAIAWGSVKGLQTSYIEQINQYIDVEDKTILIDGIRSSNSIESGHIHENQNDLIEKVRNFLLERAMQKDWIVVNRQEKIEDTQEILLNKVLNLLK